MCHQRTFNLGRKYLQDHEDVNKQNVPPKVLRWAKKQMKTNRQWFIKACKSYENPDPLDLRNPWRYMKSMEEIPKDRLREWHEELQELKQLFYMGGKVYDPKSKDKYRRSDRTENGEAAPKRQASESRDVLDGMLDEMD